jgi:hypothetical protein
MKVSELNTIIENTLFNEIKKAILNESEMDTNETYHVTCEGEPVVTCKTEEEAQEHVDLLKKDHPGKQFIIEKVKYESHNDMLDKLDEMGEQLEEKENTNMENTNPKFKSLAEALLHAKNNGHKKVKINGERYDVDECWNQMEEEELSGNQDKIDANHDGKITAKDFDILRGEKEQNEEEECQECGSQMEEDFDFGADVRNLKVSPNKEAEVSEEKETCQECGGTMSEGNCDECGKKLQESKKRTVRMNKQELADYVSKLVSESVPGLDITKRANIESGKENKENLNNIDKKIKDYLSFDGNSNPEFPEQNNKGEKAVVNNTDEEDIFVADNRGRGLENLEYDHEPSKAFKDRLKLAINGDASMGNSQEWANVVPTENGKKLEKEIERKSIEKKEEPRYKKEPQPIKEVNESKINLGSVVNEEIEKMRKLTSYDKKTQ